MKNLFRSLVLMFLLLPAWAAHADSIPDRAIVLSGNPNHPGHIANVAELYSRENLAFSDPAAPRFLFLDKKGQVALGIGGYLKAAAMYDVDGAIDNNGFCTYEIPVPFDPALRNRFGATAANSKLFLKMVATQTPVGRVIVYIETEFTGDNGNYGLKLKQAYASVGHFTLGKARSTFADGPAMAPTVDDQGPSGQVTAKNMLIRYDSPKYGGFSWAISAELPSAGYTLDPQSKEIAQRFPDIPAYVQYSWASGSHVRLSGILRELSYRDLASGSNHFETGWGVQFSAVGAIYGPLGFFGHYTYGKGIAHYINDLSDLDLDLVPALRTGRLRAPSVAGWTAGLQYNFSKKLMASASYSRSQVMDSRRLGADGYRYAQYITANAFYNPWSDLTIGLEYIHGTRKDANAEHGRANRVEAMIQYSF